MAMNWGFGGGGGIDPITGQKRPGQHITTPYGAFSFNDPSQLPASMQPWFKQISSNVVGPLGGWGQEWGKPPTLSPEDITALQQLTPFQAGLPTRVNSTQRPFNLGNLGNTKINNLVPANSSTGSPGKLDLRTASGPLSSTGFDSSNPTGYVMGSRPSSEIRDFYSRYGPTGDPYGLGTMTDAQVQQFYAQNRHVPQAASSTGGLGRLAGGIGNLLGGAAGGVGNLLSGLLGGGGGGGGGSPPPSGGGGFLNTINNTLGGLSGRLGNLSGLFGGGGGGSSGGGGGFNLGGLNIPSNLLGAGLLGTGLLTDQEPGEVGEARQFLRNRFTSPTALADQFGTQVGAFQQQYQPLLDQMRQRGIDEISQQFAAAFPGTVGAQGPQFGTMGRYLTDEALPREQAVLGDLARYGMNLQGDAAGKILDTSKPDAMSQLAAILGYDMLAGGVNSQLAQQIAQALGTTLTLDMAQAGAGLSGIMAMTSHGVAIPIEAINLSGGLGGATGTSAGASSGLGGLLAALAPAAVGGGLGNLAGANLGSNQFQSTLIGGAAGAAGGAATGAAIGAFGGPIGAGIGTLVGAIAGGIGGLFGRRTKQHAEKAANRQADIGSQSGQVQAHAAFLGDALEAAGISGSTAVDSALVDEMYREFKGAGYPTITDPNSLKGKTFDKIAQQLVANSASDAAEQNEVSYLLGRTLLKTLQAQNPAIKTLDDVPGLRQSYLDFLTGAAYIEPKARQRGAYVPGEEVLRKTGFAAT